MRSISIFRTLAVAGAVLLAPSMLSAQSVPVRDGFTFSFGLGGGSAALSVPDAGSTPRETGLSGYLRFGGAMSQNLILAAETNGWTKTIDGVDTRIGALSGIAQWYPSATNGFYVKGGLGLSAYTEDNGTDKASAVGFGYQVGTGYDFRITRNMSLTPYVNYLGMTNSDVKISGTSAGTKIGTNDFQYGLGLTWH
jgi:hypothetical protein